MCTPKRLGYLRQKMALIASHVSQPSIQKDQKMYCTDFKFVVRNIQNATGFPAHNHMSYRVVSQ